MRAPRISKPAKAIAAVRALIPHPGDGPARAEPGLRCQGCAAFSAFAADAGCPLALPAAQASPQRPESPDASAGLGIRVQRGDGYRLARIEGEVDLATACELHFMLRALLAEEPRLAVDVAGLEFTDVLGIRMLRQAAELAAACGGWVRLIGARPQFRHLLAMLELERLLPVYETEGAAARAASEDPATAPRSWSRPRGGCDRPA